MKHISEEYGTKCNLLQLTEDDLAALEPFLLGLGVRCRMTKMESVDGVPTLTIQAENVWKENALFYHDTYLVRKGVKSDLEPDSIAAYKR